MIPGGGPSLDGKRWIKSRHPTQGRRKPYLTDNVELGREFRQVYLRGLRRLICNGKLRMDGDQAFLRDSAKREAWLTMLEAIDWNVFIEGPPHGRSRPEHMVKYLARYISGGPIADRRLISNLDGNVTFWARSKDKTNKSAPFSLRGHEFVRRWTMHILPKGYTRSRSYGGFHGCKRKSYLARCSQLLRASHSADEDEPSPLTESEAPPEKLPKCGKCKVSMHCVAASDRPSWREIFGESIYRQPIYSPLHHMGGHTLPTAHPIEGYG